MTRSALILAAAAELLVGDPARWHPVAGFGRTMQRAEAALYRPSRRRGAWFGALGVAGTAALTSAGLRRIPRGPARLLAYSTVIWATLGGRSLWQAGAALAGALERNDLPAARALLPSLAGRDPSQLNAAQLARAGVESLAENTNDAVIGAFVWAAVAGPAGAAAFRAANTLDAMVGHRSARYEHFGWASARADDLAGWPSARLGAALTVAAAPAVGGSPRAVARVLRRDARAHPSPNAGPMEAAFAGALGVRLGGQLHYGARTEDRPFQGDGRAPDAAALRSAIRLSQLISLGSLVASLAGRTAMLRLLRGARR